MHTHLTLDVARALTPGDGWWDRPPRRSIIRMVLMGMVRLGHIVVGR